MEIRILLDISEKFEKALRRIAFAIVAGGGAVFAKAQNQVPAEEAPKCESAQKDDATKDDAPKAEPKKRAKARKPSAPAVEISTPAAMAEGGKESERIEKDVAKAETAEAAEAAEVAPTNALHGVYTTDVPELTPETAPTQENEDELGKGAVGEIISELTGRLINRMNEEARDKATINRNLRAKCEELQLKFPTVPALIQAIGYGNAYKACVGEG